MPCPPSLHPRSARVRCGSPSCARHKASPYLQDICKPGVESKDPRARTRMLSGTRRSWTLSALRAVQLSAFCLLGTRQEPRAIPGTYCRPPIPPIPAPPAVAASRNDVIVSTPSYSLYWNRSIPSRTSRDRPRMHGAGFTSGSSPAGPRSEYISAGIEAACDSFNLGMSHQL